MHSLTGVPGHGLYRTWKKRSLDVGQLQLLWELFFYQAQLGVLAALPQQVFSPRPLTQVEPQRGQQERLDLCASQVFFISIHVMVLGRVMFTGLFTI